jgi:chromate transporter
MMGDTQLSRDSQTLRTPGEVFTTFLKLGLTSFGGPIAHLGYFREELVNRRKWLSDHAYADLVALCQFLPGPASSQVVSRSPLMRHTKVNEINGSALPLNMVSCL